MRGDYVVRFGGDEFIFLMNHVTKELFEDRVNKIVEDVRQIRVIGAPDMRLTVSVGAVMGGKGLDYCELFSIADRLVYKSKETGKDRCTFSWE